MGDPFNYRAHEDWGLPEPADIVTFAKRMMAAGYYHRKALTPKQVGKNTISGPHPSLIRTPFVVPNSVPECSAPLQRWKCALNRYLITYRVIGSSTHGWVTPLDWSC